jgi:hypothetical protein
MRMAFSGFIWLFWVIEISRQQFRKRGISFIDNIDSILLNLIDSRDTPDFIVTHIYLLMGCSLPLLSDTQFFL